VNFKGDPHPWSISEITTGRLRYTRGLRHTLIKLHIG